MSQQAYARISDLFTALAAEYLELSETTSHVEMSGSEYIKQMDNPETGEGEPPLITNTPGDVFNSGADVAAVFSAPTPPAEPIYTMLPGAGEWTREGLLNAGQGWTDELLVANNMMTITHPAPKPPAPPVPAINPPSPTAPTPTAGATPTPGAIELDAVGLPWDSRIHSGGRTKKANGEWVAKKGVNAALVAQVTAELRQNPPKVNAPFVPPPAPHAPLAGSAAGAAPNPAPAPRPPAPAGVPKTAAEALALAQKIAETKAAFAAIPPPGPNSLAEPTDAKSLMEWVSANGYGPHMGTVSNMLGLAGFGLLLQPENAQHIKTAYNTFLALGVAPVPAA